MGNQVSTDLEVMQGVAGKLAGDYQQLVDSITTLQSQSAAHASSWTGQARLAWDGAMADVNAAWSQLNTVLDEITSNINTSGTRYADTDQSNASGYSSVPVTDITAALR
jgi:WXG100 family type VII secretion target